VGNGYAVPPQVNTMNNSGFGKGTASGEGDTFGWGHGNASGYGLGRGMGKGWASGSKTGLGRPSGQAWKDGFGYAAGQGWEDGDGSGNRDGEIEIERNYGTASLNGLGIWVWYGIGTRMEGR